MDPSGNSVVVGFDLGILRVLRYDGVDKVTLVKALRPHKARITCSAHSAHGSLFATGSLDGTIFFLNAANGYKPLGQSSFALLLTATRFYHHSLHSCFSGLV